MPRFDDADDKYSPSNTRRGENKGVSFQDPNMDYKHPFTIDAQNENLKRNLKWLACTRSKIVSGNKVGLTKHKKYFSFN